MSLSPAARAFWQIHLCVLLWGFTAIFGKLIRLPALALVWWRMLLVCVVLLLLPRVWRGLRALPRRLLLAYCGIGALVAGHWLTFYAAIKLSNASVAVACIALASVFVAFIEPLIVGRRFDLRELLLGVLVVPGVVLVVGGVPDDMYAGIVVGVVSALLVAIFGPLNKRLVDRADPLTVTGLELGAGVVFLSLLAPLMVVLGWADTDTLLVLPGLADATYLLLLAFLCTLLPFALSLVALRHMSAFGAQLAINLEPIYAIVLAILFFGEQRELEPGFYLGVGIILLSSFAHPLIARRPATTPNPETLATAEAKGVAE
ncbi:MAG: DMT family transporter [Lysobacteraceae bacterium]